MTEPTHHQIASYLINYALSELVKYVMEELYVQGPAYIYELMNKK